jgi:energy-coupling factor transporter ATP-binding protein EcfA2
VTRINPFCTSAIRPGALPYRFFGGAATATSLIDRFKTQLQGCGAIVGPHGTGKSTLLATLRDGLEELFGPAVWVQAQAAQKAPWFVPARSKLLVIDGFEQLSFIKQLRWRLAARSKQIALLVTMHQPSRWIPTLFETATDLFAGQQLLQEMLADHPEKLPAFRDELAKVWPQYAPNIREAFFALYDFYEQNYREPTNA